MKKNSNIAKASALALCILGLGLAGAGAAVGSQKLQSEQGTIKSVDPEHHSLVLTDHKGKTEHTFQWNAQTRFTAGGKARAATDLKAGEHALISYESSKGILLLKSAELTPAKGAKQQPTLPSPTPKS